MSLLSTRIARALAASFVVVAVVAACGSEGGSSFEDPNRIDSGASGSNNTSGFVGSDAGLGNSDDGGNAIDPNCKALTCADQNLGCGLAGDGCGRQIDCGGCADNERCGGPGKPSQCVTIEVATSCTPKTCAEVGVSCGTAGDGCGNVINCGGCAPDEQCGALGRPSQCVKIEASQPDGGACIPKVRADFVADNKDCGTQSDGCGGTINLGTCTAPEFCGGGGPSKCAVSGGGPCTKKTCADYPANICGRQPDGCGGVTTTECGTACALPEVCGGGGVPSQCGGGTLTSDGGGSCVPRTCTTGQCGTISDGCGGVVDCGSAACTNGTFCGGGGTPNQCGEPACTPLTQAAACSGGLNCGVVGDGCGGVVTCGNATGTCATGQVCGANNRPNVCGAGGVTADGGPGGGTCVPTTASTPGACPVGRCGPIANGCGGTYTCGTAPSYCPNPGDSCGGGTVSSPGTPSQCGGACTPRTQAAACTGLNCGVVPDGCGGSINCWRETNNSFNASRTSCPSPSATGNRKGDVCGGGVVGGPAGTPNVCGGGQVCTGFCAQQSTCTATTKTKLRGTVYAPNGTLPIPSALVYVPNGAATSPYGVEPLTTGVTGTCQTCASQATGAPLVRTTADFNGTFELDDVPAGVQFPVVIQLGKWRRMVMAGPFTACSQNNTLTVDQSRFPRTQNEGNNGVDNIPYVAISTGYVDGLECVFRKLGINDNQFGNPPGYTTDRGRIRLYRDNQRGDAQGGAVINNQTPRTDTALTNTQANLNQYDAVVFGCAGAENERSSDILNRVRTYADQGGRVFATHFEYIYLEENAPWNRTVTWDTANARSTDNSWTGLVDQTAGRRNVFSRWLGVPITNGRGVAALSDTNPPRLSIQEARNNADLPMGTGTNGVTADSWIYRNNDNPGNGRAVLHYTFDTPFNGPPSATCGRVLFSDFHVSIGNTAGQTFPNHCNSNALTPQEKVLAFFLFDLTSCIDSVPAAPQCTPKTCADYPGQCGPQSNGCGGLTTSCNPCTRPGDTCGGGGTPGVCGQDSCTPRACPAGTCSATGVPDGCGGVAQCNPCPNGQTCGGGGQANVCGTPTCTPRTCAQAATSTFQCGQTGDGCGGTLTCDCPTGQTCGAGSPGRPNICGACVPRTTCPAGLNCGQWPDGCGGVVNCGTCPDGSACGGGGQANVCGQGSCVARSCAQLGAECGQVADGCGGSTRCPDCTAGSFCNAQNLCVPPTCQPRTCAQLGVECGPASDGCGNLLPNCGTCPAGTGCGAGGTPGKCEPMVCAPLTCQQANAVCGQVANGCGGLTANCGSCPGSQSCVNGACVNACTPRTCTEAAAECGFISDGCGGALDCGNCTAGRTCGFNNQANKCGAEGPR